MRKISKTTKKRPASAKTRQNKRSQRRAVVLDEKVKQRDLAAFIEKMARDFAKTPGVSRVEVEPLTEGANEALKKIAADAAAMGVGWSRVGTDAQGRVTFEHMQPSYPNGKPAPVTACADPKQAEPEKDTPFSRINKAACDVYDLESRLGFIVDKLLGSEPRGGEVKLDRVVRAPIYELIEQANDITASVNRMHELLDRFAPVMPGVG